MAIRLVVERQAEDESLWFQAQAITEKHLQHALRHLHATIEGVACPMCEHKLWPADA